MVGQGHPNGWTIDPKCTQPPIAHSTMVNEYGRLCSKLQIGTRSGTHKIRYYYASPVEVASRCEDDAWLPLWPVTMAVNNRESVVISLRGKH